MDDALKKAITAEGGTRQLAAALGLKVSRVYAWRQSLPQAWAEVLRTRYATPPATGSSS